MSNRMLAPLGTALYTLGCMFHVPVVATVKGDPAYDTHIGYTSSKHLGRGGGGVSGGGGVY